MCEGAKVGAQNFAPSLFEPQMTPMQTDDANVGA
jgi:hypothetical protein